MTSFQSFAAIMNYDETGADIGSGDGVRRIRILQTSADYADVMRTHIIWTDIVKNLELQAAYVLVFGAAAWARFTPRDILA